MKKRLLLILGVGIFFTFVNGDPIVDRSPSEVEGGEKISRPGLGCYALKVVCDCTPVTAGAWICGSAGTIACIFIAGNISFYPAESVNDVITACAGVLGSALVAGACCGYGLIYGANARCEPWSRSE